MSKAVKMTTLWVQNYRKPGLSPSDTESGLRLYVAKSGRKSWVRFYRSPVTRKLVKMTLPYMGLAEARKRVADDRYLASQGVDPVQHDRARKQAALNKSEGTLNAVADRYLDLAAAKLRSKAYYENTLARHILPKLGERFIGEIKRSEIAAVLDHVEQKSGAAAADAAKRVLNALMNWYQDRSEFTNPMARMRARLKPIDRARTHIPSDAEIRAIWIAAGDERIGIYGQVIRLLILTGARKSEAAGLRRSEIENMLDNGIEYRVWKLPAARSKNRQAVVRPLSAAALEIIEDQPIIGDDPCGPVFTVDGRSSATMNYMEKKRLLDQIAGVHGWVPHDLRRTFRSMCSRLRIAAEVGERLLGHSRPLLDRTYNQHSFLAEMQEATNKVAAEIERIVSGKKGGKVIRLR
jgi:integrase